MPKKRKPRHPKAETDSTYFFKLVLYLVIGSQWLFIYVSNLTHQVPIPLGLLIGLGFAQHEHFKIDRKIEYALLLIAMLVGFWGNVGLGIVIN